jgi:tetratricopeptide (TPR) repeat protein
MTKTGRNDPCPCGSGKKYKQCCLRKDEAAALAAAPPPRPPLTKLFGTDAEIAARLAQADAQYDAQADAEAELAAASNAAIDLVQAGKLDEAEQAARDLLVNFPDVHDGWDRLGMVYEARGDHRQAADCYRKVIDFIRTHPDQYDPAFEAAFHKLVNRLDPPTAT